MDPPGNARSLPTYCPTCQHLCSRQDDHLAPTEVTLWASHRAKLVAASQWQLWPVETANCSLPSFQSKTRIRCIHLSGFNSLSAAWIEENIEEALFRLVVCGGFPNPRLGSSCIRWWGSGKVQEYPCSAAPLCSFNLCVWGAGDSSAVAVRNLECPDGYLLLRRILQSIQSTRQNNHKKKRKLENLGFQVG